MDVAPSLERPQPRFITLTGKICTCSHDPRFVPLLDVGPLGAWLCLMVLWVSGPVGKGGWMQARCMVSVCRENLLTAHRKGGGDHHELTPTT